MSYAPTTNNQSGQILAQGINAGTDNIAAALNGIMKKRTEAQSAIAAMDMLASLNPEALPKDPSGQVDAKFLEKFYGAPLAAQQQTIGLITSKLLMTPEDKARIGATNAQAGLMNAQTEQYKQAANAAAQGQQEAARAVTIFDKFKQRFVKGWDPKTGRYTPQSINTTPKVSPGPTQSSGDITDLPPLPALGLPQE